MKTTQQSKRYSVWGCPASKSLVLIAASETHQGSRITPFVSLIPTLEHQTRTQSNVFGKQCRQFWRTTATDRIHSECSHVSNRHGGTNQQQRLCHVQSPFIRCPTHWIYEQDINKSTSMIMAVEVDVHVWDASNKWCEAIFWIKFFPASVTMAFHARTLHP